MSSAATLLFLSLATGAEPTDELAKQIQSIDPIVLPDAKAAARMLADDARSRRDAANRRSTEEWNRIRSKDAWEKFRAEKLKALRSSLGIPDLRSNDPVKLHVTNTLERNGFRVQNVLFESRPGLVVTANLYLPAKSDRPMPGIVLCHSHHNPKSESELQEMGIGWARQGCAVIVPDLLGHGERRQHPFKSAADFAGSFRVGRQDYYFRYFTGMQLQLAGQSLCGWIATDLSRCVDVLHSLPNIDKTKTLIFGSVAGGGDPAAVAAALDERFTMAAIFNFGGPQPESPFPLPEHAETSFNYAGGGSWESTRNLAFSCRDGFLPWVIVGSIAPRKLIYAHEFSWDRERDPVWKRLQRIWSWYDPNDLAAAHGTGKLSGKAPESSHCNNIGRVHRASMAPALKRWYGLEPPLSEPTDRHTSDQLRCITANAPLKLQPVHELQRQYVNALEKQDSMSVRDLVTSWPTHLGVPQRLPAAKVVHTATKTSGSIHEERAILEVESNIMIPIIILRPSEVKRPALIIGVAQDGKSGFLNKRSEEIAMLLRAGIAIVLPDLRGTGETRPGDGRGRSSSATAISSTEWMLGRNLLGLRWRDLRSVIEYVRTRSDLDSDRLGVWGDSFAPLNADDARTEVPLDADPQPKLAEPLGGTLALIAGLLEKVRCVSAHGGIVTYSSLLESPYMHVPHDIVVPTLLPTQDLDRTASAIAPRPLRITGLVDGRNRLVTNEVVERLYRRGAYSEKRELLHIDMKRGTPEEFAAWWKKHFTQ